MPKKNKRSKQKVAFGRALGVIVAIAAIVVTLITWQQPEQDFTLSVIPMHGMIQQGAVTQTTIHVKGSGGYKHPVSLSATGQPSDMLIAFSPTSGSAAPAYTSTMTVNVGAKVRPGNCIITIKGTGADGKEHNCKYTLTVTHKSVDDETEIADSLIKDVKSQKPPAQPETEIKLQDSVHMIKKMTIDVPKEGTLITQGVYNEMHGTYEGKIATGYKLWVLAKDSYNFYLMYPPTEVVPSMQSWSQTNIRLATPGRWELHVCLANEAASKWLKVRATAGNWGGFPSLPEGMETVRSVKVKRQ